MIAAMDVVDLWFTSWPLCDLLLDWVGGTIYGLNTICAYTSISKIVVSRYSMDGCAVLQRQARQTIPSGQTERCHFLWFQRTLLMSCLFMRYSMTLKVHQGDYKKNQPSFRCCCMTQTANTVQPKSQHGVYPLYKQKKHLSIST